MAVLIKFCVYTLDRAEGQVDIMLMAVLIKVYYIYILDKAQGQAEASRHNADGCPHQGMYIYRIRLKGKQTYCRWLSSSRCIYIHWIGLKGKQTYNADGCPHQGEYIYIYTG